MNAATGATNTATPAILHSRFTAPDRCDIRS